MSYRIQLITKIPDRKDTPLHQAAKDGNLEEARNLILNGANIEAECFFHLETPLHKAAFNGNLEMVKFLIQNEAKINARNRYNQTPLHHATIGNRV